jgi:hypothetical protein
MPQELECKSNGPRNRSVADGGDKLVAASVDEDCGRQEGYVCGTR